MEIKVKKLEAAESQLIEAIRLFFEERDPVSIHTLASASLQILHDHFDKEGAKSHELYFHYHSPLIPEELRKSVNSELKEAANFFKHADKDINAEIQFNPTESEYNISAAIRCIEKIKNIKYAMNIPEFHTFDLWYFVQSRAQYSYLPIENEELYEIFKNYTKAEFLKVIEVFRRNPEIAESMEVR